MMFAVMKFASLLVLANAERYDRDHRVGNGGGAWVCRSPKRKISWIKLLDLYELKAQHQLQPRDFTGLSLDAILRFQWERFASAKSEIYSGLEKNLKTVGTLAPKRERIIHTDEELNFTRDVEAKMAEFHILRPSADSCPEGEIVWVQIVNFRDDGKIFVRKKYFDLLGAEQRAALIFHEAIYLFRRREYGDANSAITRRVVAHLFSNLPDETWKKWMALEQLREERKVGNILNGHFVDVKKTGDVKADFQISKYEVTQAQWVMVMKDNPSKFKDRAHCEGTHRIQEFDSGKVELCATLPVENVSWDSVQTFLFKLNQMRRAHFRLPSEAEWESAARAGTTTTFWFGDSEEKIIENEVIFFGADYAEYSRRLGKGPMPQNLEFNRPQSVGSLKPNPFGLFDMLGNVSEWVGIESDGKGETRIVRGGNYTVKPRFCTAASRLKFPSYYQTSSVGFRLAR